ncbi:MAG: protein-disulfide reductase DsbD family protein [Shinella sp.]|nr:protein-disulfide reductase DsbD family protein [Shinella sp.]
MLESSPRERYFNAMKRNVSILVSALLALSAPAPSFAASSDWTSTPGGQIRLTALPPAEDGTVRAMLDIRLSPGWKTYWRDPGESGIPPTIDVTAASGATLETIGFPPPRHFDDGTTRYTGYDHSVKLPFSLSQDPGSGGGKITAAVFLGICKDICIPVQAELATDTGAETFTNPLEKAAIEEAEAKLPGKPAKDFKPLSARWSEDRKRLSVVFRAPEAADGALPEVFFSGPPGFQFEQPGTVSRNGRDYSAHVELVHKPKSADLATAPILLTVRSGERAMETPLAIE